MGAWSFTSIAPWKNAAMGGGTMEPEPGSYGARAVALEPTW